MMRWLRRRRRAKAIQQLAALDVTAGPLIVLCTANQVRSPFAAGLFAKRLPGRHIESRGILRGGAPCPDFAIEAAASFGVDLRAHRAQRLDPVELLQAAVVLTMDQQVTAMLRRRFPSVRGRIFQIGLFDPDDREGLDIYDPHQLPRAEYYLVYARLVRCVDTIVSVLMPLPLLP